MAFRIVNSSEVSAFLRPDDTMLPSHGQSYIAGKDINPHYMPPPAPIESMNIIQRNLQSDFSQIGEENVVEESIYLPVPSSKETVRVYLRVKPKTEEESHYYSMASTISEDDVEDINTRSSEGEIVSIETENQVALTAPPDSNAYKNSIHGNGKLIHRYTFTKIFHPRTDQSGLFTEMVLPRLQDFLEGRNQLIFAYGATCSGKTFTIQGDSVNPGILPRALDVLFNSVGDKQLASNGDVSIKPLGFNRVATLVPREAERVAAEKKNIIELGTELTQAMQNDNDRDDSQASIVSLKSRVKDNTSIDLSQSTLHYAIWVSFAEIYNENIYDLLEKMPEIKKGDNAKPRRSPLKLADDKGGSVYIKGLKEVLVNSADEAYQLLLIGRQNLQFAATRLNHNSSRSHCIFTVKIVRVADKEQPHCARVSMLSFCDLAGSERIKKTLNTGERQKEAGNINTSLLVLGRCIKAIRHNQSIKETRKHQIVPYRDSKLTRLFQSYFTGLGKASMIVNISQSAYLFDETLQVLKFSAIASKIHIDLIKEPKPQEFKKPMEEKKKATKRKTRFSIMVENSKRSLISGRGSIAWENPQFRSTMCPNPGFQALESESTVLEENEEDEYETTGVMEETVIDSRYDGFMKVIDNLKNQLIEEKQKNLKLETEVRTELCDEFNIMMVEIETNWEKRLQDEKDRASELSDWRISKMEEALKEQKKQKYYDEESEVKLQEKQKEINQVNSELDAMKNLYNSVLEEKKKAETDVEILTRAKEKDSESQKDLQNKLSIAQAELKTSNEALKAQSTDPKIEELENSIKKFEEKQANDEAKINDLKGLLDDASEEYLGMDSKVKKLEADLSKSQRNIEEKESVIKEIKEEKKESDTQMDELKILLSEANNRADEKELMVFELEEQVEKLTNDMEQKTKEEEERWSKKKATEQEITALSDEIENLRSDKKKLRALADDRENQIVAKEKEITNMERETKNLLKVDKHNLEKITNLEAENNILRKQNKDINAKASKTELELKEKINGMENLQVALNATKKEESAVEALKIELSRKTSEKEELLHKAEKLQSEVEAKEYDCNRLKEERDKLMNHYEQQLKKKSEELMIEKHENNKIRQIMHTPTKKKDETTEVIRERDMLREELEKKSELIKNLASKVTTPKRNQKENSNDEELEQLRQENEALKNEITKSRSAHDMIINEYKEINTELLKHVPATDAKRVMSVKRTVQDSDDENIEPKDNTKNANEAGADSSMVEATPAKNESNQRRGRRTRGRKKMSATTQVSFEDSTVSNVTTDFDASVADEESKTRKPKRGSRVSKTSRPSRNKGGNTSSNTSKKSEDDENDTKVTFSENTKDINLTSEPLCDSSNKFLSPLMENVLPMKTPTTNRKRKLFTHTPGPDTFTPEEKDNGPLDSPHSIVKRQLRSRRRR